MQNHRGLQRKNARVQRLRESILKLCPVSTRNRNRLSIFHRNVLTFFWVTGRKWTNRKSEILPAALSGLLYVERFFLIFRIIVTHLKSKKF